jgi:hypothetical protein
MYGDGKAETALGNCIAEGVRDGIWKRSDLVISTKLFKCGEGINDIGRTSMYKWSYPRLVSEAYCRGYEGISQAVANRNCGHRIVP